SGWRDRQRRLFNCNRLQQNGRRAMDAVRITGHVNDRHELSVQVPDSIPPGPVSILIVSATVQAEENGDWMEGIAQEWADQLSDSRQDLYSLDDGVPTDAG